ncbi:peptidoglycan-associated lipoprotein Pal [Halomonas korlensis]|uniref:Peptidoglycan-associated lipoprotein n=1 Tax=Halomonas korlensis TaxID=463301 RepID=A0A1I7EYL8_9GAMM|nr:peptidoglycan-associated lipoprotein Pal [Halomonas korlensis]SFU28995.1 peptidoglycan-associated lipoprotein [Halomonas korlensis]
MQLKPYAKCLALALSLAVLAGCASRGGSEDGMAGSADGSRDGAAGTDASRGGQVSGDRMGDGAGQQDDARIPEVRTIYFAYDSDTIQSEFEPVLTSHARYLRNNANASVVLQGHTDERGTREYNMALSERRAGAVERYLNVQGVSPSQIDVVAYGEERPAVRGQNEEAYAQNRRVVFAY